jgi:hypothetical protein
MKQQIEQTGKIDQAAIGQLAYELWEKAGSPHGRDQEFWFKAEARLVEKLKAAQGAPAQKLTATAPSKISTPVSPSSEIRRTIAVAPPPNSQRNQRLTSQTATVR